MNGLAKFFSRPVFKAALFYFALLNLLFFPALWRDRNLMASASDTPTILPGGAYQSHVPRTFYRMRDRAPAWQFEPGLAVTHNMIYEDHELPWWNPYQGFGAPWAAGMIQQPFYPLTALAALHPSPTMLTWFAVIRLFIAGLLTYAFLRYFLRFLPSLLGGMAFMLSGYFIININLDNISTDILVPLAMIGAEELFRSDTKRSFLIGVASVWLVLISGMPESAVVILSYAYCFSTYRIFTSGASGKQHYWSLIRRVLVCNILGFALSAFLLIPMVEFLLNGVDTHRGALQGLVSLKLDKTILIYMLPLVAGTLDSARFFATHSLIFGYFGVGCCVTALSGILAAFRSVRREESRVLIFFAAALILSFAKIFGFPPLQGLGHLPILQLVNFPQYLQPVNALSVAALTAFATDRIFRRQIGRELLFALVLVVTVGAICVSLYTPPPEKTADPNNLFSYSVILGALIAGSMLLIALACLRLTPNSGTYTESRLLAIIVASLITTELSFNYVYPIFRRYQDLPSVAANPYAGAPYLTFIKQQRIGLSRVFGRQELYPDWAGAFKLFDSRFISAISPGRLFRFGRAFFNTSQTIGSGELVDRFTGEGLPYSFATAHEQRFLQLSSTRFLVTPYPLSSLQPNPLIEQVLEQNSLLAGKEPTRLNETQFTIDGEARHVLFEHPPMAGVHLNVNVPPDAPILRFSPAIHPGLFGSSCGDGVHFVLQLSVRGGETQLLYSRYLDSKHNVSERHWLNESVDLSSYAGQGITLLFSTDGGPKQDVACDWAGWGGLSFGKSNYGIEDTPNLRLAYDGEAKVYEFSSPLPRATLYQHITLVETETEALKTIADTNEDVSREIVVVKSHVTPFEVSLLRSLRKSPKVQYSSCDIQLYRNEKVVIHTHSQNDGMLMLTDTFFPGWHVYVDNQRRTILQADFMFRGVAVEKGSHLVEFRYEDSSIMLGSSVSILAVVLGSALLYKKSSNDD